MALTDARPAPSAAAAASSSSAMTTFERCRALRRNHDRRVQLLDDRRAGDIFRAEVRAAHDACRMPSGVGAEIGLARDAFLARAFAHDLPADLGIGGFGRGGAGRDPQADELHAGGVLLVSVGLLVVVRECRRQPAEFLDTQAPGRCLDDQVEGLPDVLHRRTALDGDRALRISLEHEVRDCLLLQFPKNLVEPCDVGLLELADRLQHGTRMLVLNVRHQQAEGAEESGGVRHEHVLESHRAPQLCGMQWPRAAERDQGVVARVPASLHGHGANRADHVRCSDGVDSVRSVLDRETRGAGDLGVDCLARVVDHDRLRAAGNRRGIEIAQGCVRVGYGGLRSAQVVAGGTGRSPRAPGAHSQRTSGVEPSDAAAAGANLGDLDGRHANDLPSAAAARVAHAAANVVFGRFKRLAVLDQRCLGGGAAHVKGDEVALARLLREITGGQNPRCRPRFDDVDGAPSREVRRHQAAV